MHSFWHSARALSAPAKRSALRFSSRPVTSPTVSAWSSSCIHKGRSHLQVKGRRLKMLLVCIGKLQLVPHVLGLPKGSL